MKKLAIFVEGQTEQIFTRKLLEEISGKKDIYIREEKAKSNINGERVFSVINAHANYSNEEYYILIRDCRGDSSVKSDIRDNCQSLYRQNYSKVIGLRDAYPAEELDKLKKYLKFGIPTKYMPIDIVLAIMEIEAWFLADTSHFLNIHPSLTCEYILEKLNLDFTQTEVELFHKPSDNLNEIYRLVGHQYDKTRGTVNYTVNALNYELIYCDIVQKVSSLRTFIEHLNSFFS